MVEVGDHVNAGDVLAVLGPAEQQADVDAATAAVASAEAQLRVAQATYDRQKALITSGLTTRTVYDQAQQGLRTAQGTLDGTAQLGTAKDALGYTELRAADQLTAAVDSGGCEIEKRSISDAALANSLLRLGLAGTWAAIRSAEARRSWERSSRLADAFETPARQPL